MGHTHNEKFPRSALLGAAGLIALTIIAAGGARLVGTPSMVPASSPLVIRDLRFEDTADGAVAVYDNGGLQPVNIVSPGSDAFLRATLRGLAQQRKREYISAVKPFRLTSWADGRLTLDDPATGRHIELEAFGQTNAASFARLLKPDSESQ